MASKVAERTAEPPMPGMKRVELWVWDTESPEFRAALERDTEIARAERAAAEEREALRWCEAMFDELMEEVEAEEERARAARR